MKKNDLALENFILYRNIAENLIVASAVELFNMFNEASPATSIEKVYYEIQRKLLENDQGEYCSGNRFQNYLCSLIAESENAFSLSKEKKIEKESFTRLAEKELAVITKLYNINWKEIDSYLNNEESVMSMNYAEKPGKREALHDIMLSGKPGEIALKIGEYYENNGCGLFERYAAFVWNNSLTGTDDYDTIDLDDLIGYEIQKNIILENTQFFINGLKANNMLLYGDKGTGKSSCVKAMLNQFKNQGLRMIEISKENVVNFHQIMAGVKNRGLKFIIFIDDLSFEETELTYKHFKSVIDGSIEKQPDNVLIYVTSNRRHIVKETWSEQNSSEIHASDGIQEKLSLSDRFGITVVFPSPGKPEFMEIVEGIAKAEGLELNVDLLWAEANKWEMRYHGRSGRAAKQLVTYLLAKMNESSK